jgi:hypothetical protein
VTIPNPTPDPVANLRAYLAAHLTVDGRITAESSASPYGDLDNILDMLPEVFAEVERLRADLAAMTAERDEYRDIVHAAEALLVDENGHGIEPSETRSGVEIGIENLKHDKEDAKSTAAALRDALAAHRAEVSARLGDLLDNFAAESSDVAFHDHADECPMVDAEDCCDGAAEEHETSAGRLRAQIVALAFGPTEEPTAEEMQEALASAGKESE